MPPICAPAAEQVSWIGQAGENPKGWGRIVPPHRPLQGSVVELNGDDEETDPTTMMKIAIKIKFNIFVIESDKQLPETIS